MTVTFPAGFLKSYCSQKFVVFHFQSVVFSVNINQIAEVLGYSASSSHVRRSLPLRCIAQVDSFPYFHKIKYDSSRNNRYGAPDPTIALFTHYPYIFFLLECSNRCLLRGPLLQMTYLQHLY